MTGELLEGILILSLYLGVFMALLLIVSVIADYVLPHIPFVQRFFDSLPDWEDDEE